jgi:hypothetical protein
MYVTRLDVYKFSPYLFQSEVTIIDQLTVRVASQLALALQALGMNEAL